MAAARFADFPVDEMEGILSNRDSDNTKIVTMRNHTNQMFP